MHRARILQPLLAWYAAHRRDLPWRDATDPYAVWVSEIMLQQTQVATVVPYFERWMARFPDVASLAAADVETVLRHWQGLGYYARARNLHRAAQAVVAEHGGRLPATRDGLLALPGVGRYTAGAIASIAYGESVPAVDGNVERVLARLWGVDEDVKRPAGAARILALAEALVSGEPRASGQPAEPPSPAAAAQFTAAAGRDAGGEAGPGTLGVDAGAAADTAAAVDFHPGDLAQAMMELGATVCTPRRPRCEACPVADVCVARASGRVDALPVRAPRARQRPEARVAWAIRAADTGRWLVVRRAAEGLLGGLWEFPMTEAVRQGGSGDSAREPRRDPTGHASADLPGRPPDPASGGWPDAAEGERFRQARDGLGLVTTGAWRIGAPVVHVFTHIRLTVTPAWGVAAGEIAAPVPLPAPYVEWRWVDAAALAALARSTLMDKLVAAIVAGAGQG